MAKTTQDMPSKRHFHWTTKVTNEDDHTLFTPTLNSSNPNTTHDDNHQEKIKSASVVPDDKNKDDDFALLDDQLEKDQKAPEVQTFKSTVRHEKNDKFDSVPRETADPAARVATRKKLQNIAVTRLRHVLAALGRAPGPRGDGLLSLGSRVVGTLFGNRRGHVHFAFQRNPTTEPAFLIELATPISGLVKEMASGLVRIALECDRRRPDKKPTRLLEEPLWRTYCNGKKHGFATRRECGEKDWKILKSVEPISMGAGVLPAEESGDGEIMYMRAKFERVLGSRDSEAFYMMNPDNNGAPELSVYLLRV